MPTAPHNSKCATLGCKNPRSKLSTHCLEHGGSDTYTSKQTDERVAFNNMYKTAFWRQLRIIQLTRQPLCQSCLTRGIVTQAEHVDHVFPWARIGRHAFRHNVFQSLCHECHSVKTGLEAKGIIHHYANGLHIYRLEDYGYVMTQR